VVGAFVELYKHGSGYTRIEVFYLHVTCGSNSKTKSLGAGRDIISKMDTLQVPQLALKGNEPGVNDVVFRKEI
jgi:hypothetical protein